MTYLTQFNNRVPYGLKEIMKFGLTGFMILLLFSGSRVFGQNTQVFTTSGSFTVPAGITNITVECWGGGGAGGGATGNPAAGGGGAGGTYSRGSFTVIPGAELTVTVGDQKASTATSTAAQNKGNPSWFGSASLLFASGGNGGGPALSNSTNGTAGMGTSAGCIGNSFLAGGNGAIGNFASGSAGGAGGGGAGTTGNGGNALGGTGGTGTTLYGGNGANGVANSTPGANGLNYGGGGSGAKANTDTDRAGGIGAAGQVIISWCPTYSLSETSATNACTSPGTSTVTLSSMPVALPVGSYIVTYDISVPNSTGLTALMTVAVAGSGTFTATGFVTTGTSTITITGLESAGCYSDISANNTASIVVNTSPVTPGAISGTTPQCPSLSGQIYSITAVPNATTYTWTVPTGWTITAGVGTTSITVTTGTSGQNGNITVTAGNSCGTSAASTLAVTVSPPAPVTPGVISGTTPQCPSLPGQIYSITAVPNATTYTWTVPTGWTITAGAGTTSITVTTGTSGQNGNITVTAGNSCGTSAASTLAVTVSPPSPVTPGAISGTTQQCPSLPGQIYSITAVPNATTYTWTVPTGWTITAGAGTTSITVTTGTSGQNGNITVTAGNSCGTSAASTLAVVVNPTPVVTASPASQTICSGTATSILLTSTVTGTVFTWTVTQSGVTGASSGSGDAIAQTLATTATIAGTATYTISSSAAGCAGTPIIVVITVNPTPAVTANPLSQTICSGTAPSIALTSNVSGTTFNWTVAVAPAGNITGASAGSGTTIAQTLENTSPLTATVTYTITPTANGCLGTPINVVITVNPKPALSSPLSATVCSGSTFNYTPTSNTPTVTFGWSRAAVIGIQNIAATGTGSISETLVNITATPKTVVYIYTLTANGCTKIENLSVIVYPLPTLLSNLNPPAVCSNSLFSYVAVSSITGTVLTWERAVVTGISNPEGNGTGNISESLINTTSSVVVVPYVYTLSVGGCADTVTVNATIKPSSTVNPVTNSVYCKGDITPIITLTSPVAGTTYTWTNNNTSIGLAGFGSGNIPSFVAANTTNAPISATVTIAPSSGGCTGLPATYLITVNPSPVVNAVSPIEWCNGASATGINFSSPTSGGTITYSWTSSINVGFGTSGSGNIPPFTATNPGTATISVTATANGCVGTVTTFTVTVYPLPAVAATASMPAICMGGNTVLTASGAQNYTWSPATYLSSTTGAIVTASPTETITYTVTGANANGCSNSATVTITVNPLPIISITPDSPSICPGSSTLLTASGAVSYSWSPPTGLSATTGATVTASPSATTTYTVTGTDGNTCINTQDVTVTVYPVLTLSSSLTPPGVCSNSVFSYTPTSAVGGTTFAWSRAEVPGISNLVASGTNNPNEILENTTYDPIVVTYVFTLTANGCSNTQNVLVTVSPLPTLSSEINPPNVCSSHIFSYTPTSFTTGTTFSWSRAAIAGISNPAASGTGAINEILLNTTLSSVLVTYVYTLNLNGCTTNASIEVLVVPAPPVSASASVPSVCSGTSFDLFSSTPVVVQTIALLNENFNAANTWTRTNTSTGGTTGRAAWRLRANDWVNSNSVTFRSNDLSQFYLSDSYWQNGTITSTTLESPVMSTVGYLTLSLNFWHYFDFVGVVNESAKVQVSTNNGASWTTVATYTSDQGTSTGFVNPVINLNAYINNATFKVRFFYYSGARARYWAIDNVTVTGTAVPTITWTSNPVNPALTPTDVANVPNVTQTQTTTYTATYSYPGIICTGQASVVVQNVIDTEPPVIQNMPDDVEIACSGCIQAFINANFEDNPSIACWAYVPNGGVPGWQSTVGTIEIQKSGCVSGVPSYSGNYHAELNSNAVGDVYQEFCTVPTTTVSVSFAHRKRVPPSPNTAADVMGVYTGPDLTHLSLIYTASTTNQNAWTPHTVNVPIPVGQTSTVFLFRAISSSSGNLTYGNLIDDIRAVTLFDATLIPTATDNCSASLTIDEQKINGTCSSNYQLIRTWTATDPSGNSSTATQTVTVGDFVAPVITITPETITTNCTAPGLPTVAVTDNCISTSAITLTYLGETRTDGSCPNNYTLTRTWSATDLCSNTSTKSQIVTVHDTIAPVITLPASTLTMDCFDATAVDVWTATASATDNCDGTATVSASYDAPSGDCNQPVTVTFTSVDACGNSSTATKSFTVNDDTDPVVGTAINALNATLQCSNTAGIDEALTWLPVATDNCTAVPVIHEISDVTTPDATCPNAYVRIRTWNFTDACGNVSSNFIQTITVVDNTAPVITTVAGSLNVTLQCSDAVGIADALALVPEATDNCTDFPVINMVSDVTTPDASCANAYLRIRTWNFVDGCNNTSTTFQQTITVIDNTKPVLTTAAGSMDATLECDDATGLAAVLALIPTATDNCSPAPTIHLVSDITTPSVICGNNFIQVRTWNFTDGCNNTSDDFIQTISVSDNTAPLVYCPPSDAYSCDALSLEPSVTGMATANDNCDTDPAITWLDVTVAGSCAGNYQIIRTWKATDTCGNFNTCDQTIFVQDATSPVIVCSVAGNQTVIPNSGLSYVHPDNSWDATATDNCSGVTNTVSLAGATISGPHASLNGITFNEGVTTVTWTATDGCGNTSTCQFTVTLESKPEIECPADLTMNADLDMCSATINPGMPTLLSGALPVTYTWVMTGATTDSGTGSIGDYAFNVGETTITWTATNLVGSDVCVQTITVIDNQLPTFGDPADLSYCVENIYLANYWDPTIDITPNRPEYYIFVAGNTDLDLLTSTFNDNCASGCTFEIRWRIDFEDLTYLPALPATYITGQPSIYASDIHFPGIVTGNMVHHVTYQIVDCSGNVSATKTVNVTVKPRPNVIKLN